MSDTSPIVESTNHFALDLYRALGRPGENLFLSPASVAIALAMTWAATRGDTAREIAATLHLPDVEPARVHAAFGALMESFSFEVVQPEKDFLFADAKSSEDVDDPIACQVAMANALWVRIGLRYQESYVQVLESYYQSGLHTVDFAADREAARLRINRWVGEQTREKIPELLPYDSIDEDIRLVLTNAVYFKAQWSDAFEPERTTKESFHLGDGETLEADLMHRVAQYHYAEDDLAQVLELPYVGGRFSMLVLLPRERDGLRALEDILSVERLLTWRRAMQSRRVHVSLPRFSIRRPFRLGDVLPRMGMPLAFDTDAADFSGLTTEEPLFIGEVLHEAFVDVDEKGTEAAAATAVMVLFGAMPSAEPPPPIPFRADHPFVFAIVDTESGLVLFMGNVKTAGK